MVPGRRSYASESPQPRSRSRVRASPSPCCACPARICPGQRLRHHAIEPRALEPAEPILRDSLRSRVAGVMCTGAVTWRSTSSMLCTPLLANGFCVNVFIANARADRRTRPKPASSQHSIFTRDAAGCTRSCSASKSSPLRSCDHDLAIQHAALRQLSPPAPQPVVPGSTGSAIWYRGSGFQDLVAIAKHHRAKAIPLGLKRPFVASAGMAATRLASMGGTGGMTGRFTPPSYRERLSFKRALICRSSLSSSSSPRGPASSSARAILPNRRSSPCAPPRPASPS